MHYSICYVARNQGDLFDQDLSDAAVVIVNNTAFPEHQNDAVLEKLHREVRNGRSWVRFEPGGMVSMENGAVHANACHGRVHAQLWISRLFAALKIQPHRFVMNACQLLFLFRHIWRVRHIMQGL